MKLNLIEIVCFDSPYRINWEATEEEIVQKIADTFPNDKPSALAVLSSTICMQIRRMVKKFGVHNLYLQVMAEKEKIEIDEMLDKDAKLHGIS